MSKGAKSHASRLTKDKLARLDVPGSSRGPRSYMSSRSSQAGSVRSGRSPNKRKGQSMKDKRSKNLSKTRVSGKSGTAKKMRFRSGEELAMANYFFQEYIFKMKIEETDRILKKWMKAHPK